MMDPEDRVESRHGNAAHMATCRRYIIALAYKTACEDVIIVMKTFDRSGPLSEDLFEVWILEILADVDASGCKCSKVTVGSVLDHDETAAHLVLADLIQNLVQGVNRGLFGPSMAEGPLFGIVQGHLR